MRTSTTTLAAAALALTLAAGAAQAAPATCITIAEAAAKAACVADEITQLRAEASRLALALARGRGNTAALEAQIAALEARLTALGGKVAEGQRDVGDRINAVLAALTALEARVTAAERDIVALKATDGRHDRQIAALEADRLALEGGVLGGFVWVDDPRDTIRAPLALGAVTATLGVSRVAAGPWGLRAEAFGSLGAASSVRGGATLGAFGCPGRDCAVWRVGAEGGYAHSEVKVPETSLARWVTDGVRVGAFGEFSPKAAPALVFRLKAGADIGRAYGPDVEDPSGADPYGGVGIGFRY